MHTSEDRPHAHRPCGQQRRENGLLKEAGALYHDQLPGDDWLPGLYFDEAAPGEDADGYFDDTDRL